MYNFTTPIRMSSASRAGALRAVWRVTSNARNNIKTVISAFDEVIGQAITDDYGDVWTGKPVKTYHWRWKNERE